VINYNVAASVRKDFVKFITIKIESPNYFFSGHSNLLADRFFNDILHYHNSVGFRFKEFLRRRTYNNDRQVRISPCRNIQRPICI
jgi:hypothetical protein